MTRYDLPAVHGPVIIPTEQGKAENSPKALFQQVYDALIQAGFSEVAEAFYQRTFLPEYTSSYAAGLELVRSIVRTDAPALRRIKPAQLESAQVFAAVA